MSDVIDQASDVEELFRRAALTRAHRGDLAGEADGSCLFCDAPLAIVSARRWCDADCRDGWEAERQGLGRNPPTA